MAKKSKAKTNAKAVKIDKLDKDLKKFGRDINDYTKLALAGPLDVICAPGIDSVTFQGNVKSETDPTDMYRATVQFIGVEFLKVKSRHTIKVVNGENVTIKGDAPKGHTLHMRAPAFRGPGIKVRLKCACPDFRFNFEKQLYDKSALIGNWRKYKRTTDPMVRPANPKNPNPIGADFKNPDNYLGACKHVYSMFNFLKNANWTREI